MADGEQIEIHMTMRELECKLEKYDIVRVYQGYLVNLKYVQRIERTDILLNYNGGISISISREKVQELKAIYLSYLRKIGAVLFDDAYSRRWLNFFSFQWITDIYRKVGIRFFAVCFRIAVCTRNRAVCNPWAQNIGDLPPII